MQRLDINQFPLTGQSLIEASAGTGKTFTITALYNRLLIAHNTSLPRLGCDQILVVTFTRAATEELRGRIRERIRASFEDSLRIANGESAIDGDFEQQLQQLSDLDINELSYWLQANLALMDESSVYTIHGFCQRMLKQFAFDSGVMFDAELVLDSEQYLQQACEDIWRQQCYHLSSDQGRYLLNRYAGPDALFHKFRSWLSRPDIEFIPQASAEAFEARWRTLKQQFSRIAKFWHEAGGDNIQQLIEESGVDKRSYSSRYLPSWIKKVSGYLSGDFYLPHVDEMVRFSAQTLHAKTKKGEVPQHAVFNLIEQFIADASQLALQLDIAWFKAVRDRYFILLEQAGALTPDDLLRLLSLALQSDQGDRLAAQIRSTYPVAMIDEFQDTDPQQYEIFNRIYPAVKQGQGKEGSGEENNQADDSHYGLYMIGDPKQAIYGFRGADIFTYMTARRTLNQQQRFTLDTNWRSHSQLISAVNDLWQQNKSPFVFDRDIDFVAVNAAGKHDAGALQLNSDHSSPEKPKPLQLWLSQDALSRSEGQQLAAQQCAQQIAGLVHGDQATLGQESVKSGDIAVLVRSRRQAGWIREALTAQGIGSVFLTRDSVFDSQEAIDLLSCLAAWQQPSDERLVRTALATETFGMNAHQLDHLLNDESAWEQQLQTLQEFQWHWRHRGVMAAIMLWLESRVDGETSLAVKLRQRDNGERRLTNLMHLGELLQTASRKLRGQQALLRWFGERIFDPDRNGEEAQLRLETDDNLVTIVTIHKSKGLEYPLVFLPFLWDDSFIPQRMTEAQYYQGYEENSDDGGVVLNLAPDDEAKDLAIRDIKAEYLRLLYVALTRAKFGCYIWLLDVVSGTKNKKSVLPNSALGYLLQINEQPDWQELQQRIQSDTTYVGPMPTWFGDENSGQSDTEHTPVVARPFTRTLKDSWRVSSYSQLAAHHDVSQAAPSELEIIEDEHLDLEVAQEANAEITTEPVNLHYALEFPRGADPGTCLHAMFEHWDFNDAQSLREICQQQLTFYGLAEQDVEATAQWLSDVVATPLTTHGEQFYLSDLSAEMRLDEMEFYLPIGHKGDTGQNGKDLTAVSLNRLIDGKKLMFDPLRGYLKGFIDLIFCYNGRYYVADYKSNYLGHALDDYLHASLAASMDDHDYDIQAGIYTLALDRLLAQRLRDYCPEKHLGGVFYFYLRGMNADFSEQFRQQKKINHTAAAPGFDLFTQEELGDSEFPDSSEQQPGVFYQASDMQQLRRWRYTLLGLSSDTDNGNNHENTQETGV